MNGHYRGPADPMINAAWKKTQSLPRRIVVELEPDEFEMFDRACGRIGPADFLRLIALRVAVDAEARQREAKLGVHIDVHSEGDR